MRNTFAIVGLISFLPLSLQADVLVMLDGRRLEGRVEAVVGTTERIAFISGTTGRLELPVDKIGERIDESDAIDWTRVGQQFLNNKRYTPAVQMFQRALEADPNWEDARKGLSEAQGAIDAQQQERIREVQEAMNKELERVPQLIEEEKFPEAEEVLSKILSGEATQQQRTAAQRIMRDLYIAWGFSRFDRLDYKGAEDYYQRVLEMDPTNETARDQLLQIWRNDPAKRPEVLKAFEAKLQNEPNNLEYNRTVGDLRYSAERWLDAIEPLKKVASAPRYAGQGYDTKLRRTFESAINDLSDSRKLDDAIKLYEEMIQIFPNTDPTTLEIIRFERDKSRLARDDYDGQALLVKKVYDQGLTQFAKREALLILKYDPENEIADSLLRRESIAEIARIQEAMRGQEWLVARDMASRFVAAETRYADLIQAANDLFNRADIEAKREAKENRETASVLAERGVQYYNEALRYVDQMTDTTRRSDSRPISPKQEAIKLSQRAIEHMETALRIDPSLGPITGMDLTARLRDARTLYNGLTDRPRPLPRSRNR